MDWEHEETQTWTPFRVDAIQDPEDRIADAVAKARAMQHGRGERGLPLPDPPSEAPAIVGTRAAAVFEPRC